MKLIRKLRKYNSVIVVFLIIISISISFVYLSKKNYENKNKSIETELASNRIYPNIECNFNEWQNDVETFQINREEARSFFITHLNFRTLLSKVKKDIFSSFKIEDSENIMVLNGDWKFSLNNNPRERNMEFFRDDYDTSLWDDIKVPSNWQYEGYDFPIYVNFRYPWTGYENLEFFKAPEKYNPIGNYKRVFKVDESWLGDKIYISFQGVESCFYLWINGQFVGYSEDSFSPSEFDITDFVNKGSNTLSVQVFRWSDGSFVEDQDFIRVSGIFRDVYIYRRPKIHIRDFEVVTELDDDYRDGKLFVNFNILNYINKNKGYGIDINLFDKDWNLVQRTSSLGNFDYNYLYKDSVMQTNQIIGIDVSTPQKWSAEDPNLYNLVIVFKNDKNRELETIHSRIGFREFKLFENRMYLNGEEILFKGVNRHETHPQKGRAIEFEDMIIDIREMKRNNINAVRTSHYPNHPYFMNLCNEYGIYVIDEANIEAHGVEGKIPGDLNQWRGACFDRVRSLTERDKNYPCVLIWSLGNESGGGTIFKELYDYLKQRDKTRLVHYEGEREFYNSTDIVSKMYIKYDDIPKESSYIYDKPYLLCEYLHSMGNSGGSIDKYIEKFESINNVQGGFIWDFIDQSIYKDIPSVGIFSDISKPFTGQFEGYIKEGFNKNGYSGIIKFENFKYVKFDKGFTIDLKVKPSVYEGEGCVYLSKGEEFGVHEVSNYMNSNERAIEFYVSSKNRKETIVYIVDDSFYDKWHKVFASFDGRYLKMYIDDILIGEKEFNEEIVFLQKEVQIGGNRNPRHSEAINGVLDDVRLFSRGFDSRVVKESFYYSKKNNVLWLDFDNKQDILTVEKGKGKYLAYGGDFNDAPNDFSFCANGIFLSTREPKPQINKIKYAYQNFQVLDKDILNGEIIVKNKNLFDDLSNYKFKWDYLVDGNLIEGDSRILSMKPNSSDTFVLPDIYKLGNIEGKEFFVNFKVELKEDNMWGKKGFIVASEQIKIPFENIQINRNIDRPIQDYKVIRTDDIIGINSKNYSINFDIKKGALSKYECNGNLLLTNPINFDFWNPLNDNERLQDIYDEVKFWKYIPRNNDNYNYDIYEDENNNIVLKFYKQINELNNSYVQTTYKINKFGDINVDLNLDLKVKDIPHARSVGFKVMLPKEYSNMTFYGRGPFENYNDRKYGSQIGVYKSTVKDQYTDYITPQRTGNLTDIRWVNFSKKDNVGIMFLSEHKTGDFIQVNAVSYNDDEFEKNHKYLMKESGNQIINLRSRDYGSTFETFDKERLNFYVKEGENYKFSFIISSVLESETPMDVWKRIKLGP